MLSLQFYSILTVFYISRLLSHSFIAQLFNESSIFIVWEFVVGSVGWQGPHSQMFLYENNFEQYLSIACSSSYLSVKPMGEVISRWLYVSKSESGTKDFFPKYALHSSLLRLGFFATSTYNLLLPSIFRTNACMWQIVLIYFKLFTMGH